MSQKSTRRTRRQTNDEDSASSKASTPKPNGTEDTPPEPEEKIPEHIVENPPTNEMTNETETIKEKETAENETTNSRSATPQTEEKMTNGHGNENPETPTKDGEEMDPLIVSDEPDPELNFEENSDFESGKESPILSRCTTRRSLTRNIPTPKTPKSEETPEDTLTEEAESQDGDEKEEELNATFESCSENISTKAQAGGDSTRLDYIESNLESNSFLQGTKNKSFGEAMRHLSTRRTIRPISDEYRKRLLQTNSEKKDLVEAYPSRHSVERVSMGIKRRNCSEEEEFTKRFKSDSSGFFSRFTSPLTSIRNTFRSDLASSTPKLTGYKDDNFLLEDDGINSKMYEVKDGERRWCSIM